MKNIANDSGRSPKFEVLFLEDAREFLLELDEKSKTKIIFNIDKAKYLNDPKLFKKLTDPLWEFRTKYGGLQYRLLAFWGKTEKMESLVVVTQGFVKKTDKIQNSELNKARRLRQLYFFQKRIEK